MRKVYVFVLICMIIFLFFYYIFLKMGNNRISNEETRIDDILEKCLNYEADITVLINSNKTENVYKMNQKVNGDYSKTTIKEPINISGMVLEKNNNILKVTNSLLNVEKCYEDQKNILNNFLFLNVFVDEFRNSEADVKEDEENIKVEIKLENNLNTYVKYKELIIDKKSSLPKELVIKDNTKQVKIRIIYNDIKI